MFGVSRNGQVLGSFVLLLHSLSEISCANTTALPSPIFVPPSQYWEGIDGSWSTFHMAIGTPPQTVRLLPSSSGNALWPILPQGCPNSQSASSSSPDDNDPNSCNSLRGELFRPNESSSWNPIALFQLVIPNENALGIRGNSSWGYENSKIGLPTDQSLPSISQQIVEGIATTNFWIGSLGLNPNAINLTTIDDPKLSFLGALVDARLIPSASWGYTASAKYHQPTAYGSLTLGGYDSSRFEPNNVTFAFGPDSSRDLLVGLQATYWEGNNVARRPLDDPAVYAFLNSAVPDLWLPVPTCRAFEAAFGLSYNATENGYFVNDSLHDDLMALNPSITLQLGTSTRNESESVDIVLPYASFDLQMKDTTGANSSSYFPLRRAQNDTQYTLGRAFFQNAYVIADYERRNFSISQAVFPDLTTRQNLVTIYPPGFIVGSSLGSKGSRLGTGAIAGIAVGGIIGGLTLLFSTLGYLLRRIRHTQSAEIQEKKSDGASDDQRSHPPDFKAEMSADGRRGLFANSVGDTKPVEPVELPDSRVHEVDSVWPEMDHGHEKVERELDAGEWAAELPPGNENSNGNSKKP